MIDVIKKAVWDLDPLVNSNKNVFVFLREIEMKKK